MKKIKGLEECLKLVKKYFFHFLFALKSFVSKKIRKKIHIMHNKKFATNKFYDRKK